jgi:RNA polymerase sigma-70 factor (ECF subfamily)
MANFPTTRWLLVCQAAGATKDARRALEELCRIYHRPLLAYTRMLVTNPSRAEDVLQGFLEKLVRGDLAGKAEPARGSFRSLVRTALRNFVATECGKPELPLVEGDCPEVAVVVDGITPERQLDLLWKEAVRDHVLDRLGREEERAGRGARFRLLRGRLVGDDDRSYAELAAEEGGTNPVALRVAFHRLLRRFREIARQEVGDTTPGAAHADLELRVLLGLEEEAQT